MKEGDKVSILFAEVMFDKKNNISGDNPAVLSFIKEKAGIFRSWGYDVHILCGDKDYLDVFHHRLTRSPDESRIGLTHGFMIAIRGKCSVKRECKINPMTEWKKKHATLPIIEYEGIAADEPRRLKSMGNLKKTVSLLQLYGYTEDDCMELCRKYDMVSPQYNLEGVTRDGCWFCPHSKFQEHLTIARKYPNAWEKFVSLESTPELAYPRWDPYGRTNLHEIDKRIRALPD